MIYLLIILVIATLLRVLFLGTIPNGFFCDEASNAYDSYSILNTLKDQHGAFLPFFTRSIDDYREALFIYLGIPFIKLFGLNEFAARLPAAFTGILTVLVIYYLVKELFDNKTALIASLLLAISPWHIQFSRIAFRAILIPLLFCLALLFFAKSFQKPKYLPISALIFGFSLYTYASARVFVPLFMLGLVIIFWRHFWKNKQQTIIALILFSGIFIPLLLFWISPEGMARAKGTGVEFDPVIIGKYYLSYFKPQFLFFKGDYNPRHSAAKIGELYYFEIFTVIWGLISIIKENRKERAILLLWLFLYPFPAAMTSPVHALRALGGVPLFTILSAYGLVKIINLLGDRRKKISIFIIGAIIVASLGILIRTYFINYPLYTTHAWQYGMKEAIEYAENNNYKCIVMSNKIYFKKCGSLHTFIPFYTKYPPEVYQKQYPITPVERKQLFLGEASHKIGKYNITSVDKDSIESNENCLYIIAPKDLELVKSQGYQWSEVHTVKDKRGIEYLKLIEINS
ncbi:MAG: glycosyltransferase family 39 protein [Xenococcaceae cyanobacterium MO_207.B15]|nr:glycosyltransferase family 39 protein [Xenococcaceae cyanobacterium MO_207.B15]